MATIDSRCSCGAAAWSNNTFTAAPGQANAGHCPNNANGNHGHVYQPIAQGRVGGEVTQLKKELSKAKSVLKNILKDVNARRAVVTHYDALFNSFVRVNSEIENDYVLTVPPDVASIIFSHCSEYFLYKLKACLERLYSDYFKETDDDDINGNAIRNDIKAMALWLSTRQCVEVEHYVSDEILNIETNVKRYDGNWWVTRLYIVDDKRIAAGDTMDLKREMIGNQCRGYIRLSNISQDGLLCDYRVVIQGQLSRFRSMDEYMSRWADVDIKQMGGIIKEITFSRWFKDVIIIMPDDLFEAFNKCINKQENRKAKESLFTAKRDPVANFGTNSTILGAFPIRDQPKNILDIKSVASDISEKSEAQLLKEHTVISDKIVAFFTDTM